MFSRNNPSHGNMSNHHLQNTDKAAHIHLHRSIFHKWSYTFHPSTKISDLMLNTGGELIDGEEGAGTNAVWGQLNSYVSANV